MHSSSQGLPSDESRRNLVRAKSPLNFGNYAIPSNYEDESRSGSFTVERGMPNGIANGSFKVDRRTMPSYRKEGSLDRLNES